MIYVVEFPAQGRAHAWFAFDQQDLARKTYATDNRKEWEIFDVVTVRELLDMVGKTGDTPDARAEFPAICSLGDEHGLDMPLYRADYLLGAGVFQAQAVSETDACVAALMQRTTGCKIFWSDSEATAAVENDALFDGEAGI